MGSSTGSPMRCAVFGSALGARFLLCAAGVFAEVFFASGARFFAGAASFVDAAGDFVAFVALVLLLAAGFLLNASGLLAFDTDLAADAADFVFFTTIREPDFLITPRCCWMPRERLRSTQLPTQPRHSPRLRLPLRLDPD